MQIISRLGINAPIHWQGVFVRELFVEIPRRFNFPTPIEMDISRRRFQGGMAGEDGREGGDGVWQHPSMNV